MASPLKQRLPELDCLKPMTLPPLRENPLVSVLIGNYNYARYIGAAIESVLAQDYPNFEICICDDGSSDESVQTIEQYVARDPRIRLVAQPNGGQASALNAAWQLANGDLIALLDSDDIWVPSKLGRIVERFRSSPQSGMVTHAVRYVRSGLDPIRPQPDRGLDEGWLAPDLLAGLLPRMPPCSALALRREVAELLFPVPGRLRGSADVLIRELAALITLVASVDEPLTLYRMHGMNLVGLSHGPTDLDSVRRNLARIDEAWLDRQAFAFLQHHVTVPGQAWLMRLGAELRLTEGLLLGQPIDPLLLPYLPVRWLTWFWRIAFFLPLPLAMRLLHMRWSPSTWKTCLKVLLRFRRRALTSHDCNTLQSSPV
jgi:glycosyltransferase involved in cell wall biosynthesis